jgi:hypothetical protein
MDILAPRQQSELHADINNIIAAFQFDKTKAKLKGSASYKSQQYFSDYDLLAIIKKHYDAASAFHFINVIIHRLADLKVFITEIKLQTKSGTKIRWHYGQHFTESSFVKYFPDVSFIKIDIIARINNIYNEVSCIYNFDTNSNDETKYVSSLVDDIKDYKKKGNYYKVLKRLFSLYKLRNDKNKLVQLSMFLNNNYGKLYQETANLEAIEKLKRLPIDRTTQRAIAQNLKEIEHPDIKKNEKVLNSKAKEYYNNNF